MASSSRLTIRYGPDPERTYTTAEERRLTRNLRELTSAVHSGKYNSTQIDIHLMSALHRGLFDGVRDHAGRYRRKGVGTEHLEFGPHVSCNRSDVEQKIDDIRKYVQQVLPQFEEFPNDPNYELFAMQVAVKVHADYIRVHPFEDGNGRTGRLLVDVVLVRLGLPPVAVEVPRQEYLNTLNHYYMKGELQPLLDLYLRLADEQLPPIPPGGGPSPSP